jgi:hypothetical protein
MMDCLERALRPGSQPADNTASDRREQQVLGPFVEICHKAVVT